MSRKVRQLLARVRGAIAAQEALALLEDAAEAVSAFETVRDEWRLEAYSPVPLLTADLSARLALVAAVAGGELIDIRERSLFDRDWVAENQRGFPPLRIGRVFVYGSHYHRDPPAGTIAITLDAATAFGTGEHPSTQGCLMALQALACREPIRHPLDIGTGTGILAIAAAKLLHRKVLAADIDPGAVAVARHNVARNGVARLVSVGCRSGYRGGRLRRRGYDLVLANILARPLAVMAPDLALYLTPGGHAVLSGLLPRQERVVLAPHRALGLVLAKRIVIDGWSTLILRAGTSPRSSVGSRRGNGDN
jgi:ribosomal protein L11 methyltransferase